MLRKHRIGRRHRGGFPDAPLLRCLSRAELGGDFLRQLSSLFAGLRPEPISNFHATGAVGPPRVTERDAIIFGSLLLYAL